jgi:hypothetical protein
MQTPRRLPSPALLVASAALAVALGGTGYAAVVLPANSVGTAQLKDGAVVGRKVKAHSLQANSFAAGQLPRGKKGADGLPGAAGATGAQGPKGDPATKLFATVKGSDGTPVVASPGVNSSRRGGGAGSGIYAVTFPQSVSECAPVVSITTNQGGQADAFVPAPGANLVNVDTFDSTGSPDDRDFTLAVFC